MVSQGRKRRWMTDKRIELFLTLKAEKTDLVRLLLMGHVFVQVVYYLLHSGVLRCTKHPQICTIFWWGQGGEKTRLVLFSKSKGGFEEHD